MSDLFENPMGTNGFEFVEYVGDKDVMHKLFTHMGFAPVAKHKSKDITLYRQGGVNFLLNCEKTGQPGDFTQVHDSGANAMCFKVRNLEAALAEGAKRGVNFVTDHGGSMGDNVPAIEGIGGSLLYFVEDESAYMGDFEWTSEDHNPHGAGMTYIDHLTHNVYRGNMDKWAKFYEDIFNFREIRYFDIEGKLTGLKSRAMTSPCGKIRIPLNESSDDKSQIEEFLKRYNGEGIQHIAMGTDDICATVDYLSERGTPFQSTPDTYYEKLDTRVKGHGENVEELRKRGILVDGAPTEGQGLLLQIFTQDAIGPIFFELIQRKGNEGFGEGNFKALFESIEEDQIRRGVLDNGSNAA